MKISTSEYHIIAIFNQKEKDSGLLNYLELKMPFFGTSFSNDKLTWQVETKNVDKFYSLIKKYQDKNRQTSLF